MLREVARIGTHPVLWALIACLVCWRLYVAIAPRIHHVELDASGRLEVSGRGFGTAKGGSRVEFGGLRNQVPLEVVEWKDNRVVAILGTPTNGSITITRDLYSLELPATKLVRAPQLHGLPSQPYGYAVPVEPTAPWPLFRRNHRNTGQGDFPAVYDGKAPWSFQTASAVTSTPVIDAQGSIYFGSGDGSFYAVDASGALQWRHATEGRITGAAALLRAGAPGDAASIVFPSADGNLYRASLSADALSPPAAFASSLHPPGYDRAFESSIAIGDDGTMYAGNNQPRYFALTAAGTPKWTYRTDDSARSTAAIGDDGTVFWGSLEGSVHAVNTDGSTRWTTSTGGIVNASAAIGSDGTVYIGSFDNYLYALDPDNGRVSWSFKTGDHISATVALGEDAQGSTTAIYLASGDGTLYALNRQGGLLWKYETGEAIRTSPAIGLDPKGERPGIVYFGSAGGKLYALDAATGQRRWSFDTTPSDPELRDHNDVTSSIALSPAGVFAGTESGAVWFVPYDHCLHASDARCSTAPGEDLPADHIGLVYVSPGGTMDATAAPRIPTAPVITLRLLARAGGETIEATLCQTPYFCSADAVKIETKPAFAFRAHISGSGRYLHIVPAEMLRADTDYDLRVEADYYTGGGYQIGNLSLSNRTAGTVIQKLQLRTDDAAGAFPATSGTDSVPAFELARISAPNPAALTSLHQAGLDASAWILSVIHQRRARGAAPGGVVVWGIGARRDANGNLIPDTDERRTVAFNGRHEAGSFILEAENFVWTAGTASIPVHHFELRGQFGADLKARGASFFAEARDSSIPGFATQAATGGLLGSAYDGSFVSGTYLTRPYDAKGTANKRPRGLRVAIVERARPLGDMSGKVVADLDRISDAHELPAEHRLGMVLIDKVTDRVVPLDYANNIYVASNAEDDAVQVILSVPPDTPLSHDVEIVVLVDAFPVYRRDLGWNRIAVK